MGDETKRIGVTVPVEVWKRFRSKCFWDLKTMQEVLLEKVLEYLSEKTTKKPSDEEHERLLEKAMEHLCEEKTDEKNVG